MEIILFSAESQNMQIVRIPIQNVLKKCVNIDEMIL